MSKYFCKQLYVLSHYSYLGIITIINKQIYIQINIQIIYTVIGFKMFISKTNNLKTINVLYNRFKQTGKHFIHSYNINVLRDTVLILFKIFLDIISNITISPID